MRTTDASRPAAVDVREAPQEFTIEGVAASVAQCINRLRAQGWRFLTEPVESRSRLWTMTVVRPPGH